MMRPLIALCMLVLFTASCAIWPAPQSPAQAVYMMKASFLVSLRVADDYAALPRCPAAPLCSDEKVLSAVRASARATQSALDTAEAVVTGPAFQSDDTRAKALAAAQGALDTFSAITAKLEEKL